MLHRDLKLSNIFMSHGKGSWNAPQTGLLAALLCGLHYQCCSARRPGTSSVTLSAGGVLKLGDFGIAKVLSTGSQLAHTIVSLEGACSWLGEPSDWCQALSLQPCSARSCFPKPSRFLRRCRSRVHAICSS